MISFGAQVGLAPGAGGGRALGLGGILAFSGETGEVGKGGPLVGMAELVGSLGFWRGASPGPPVFPLLTAVQTRRRRLRRGTELQSSGASGRECHR